jgi:serine/threonine-protein kinase
MAEQMPQSIGRYQVHESIGYGAMGAVYKAFDPLIKRTLAIKTIRLDIPRNSPQYKSFIERFYHEARISGTLSHPNIVTLFDIGEENGIPYLAMEYVEGETIAGILEKGSRFPPEKVIGLVSQVASAIDYAHSKGVIHRDIKPSNLILFETDKVKVTDFGIAKLVDADMTQAGTLLGTPSYMSPEQAMGDRLDGRTDIFSLGVCAFEMLSGEQPFPGNNVTSILYKLVHVDPIEPANLEMNGLVPQKWHEVFSKVLSKRPDDRYQTATEFVQDLEYCLGSWFGAAMGTEETVGDFAGAAIREAAVAASSASTVPPPPPPPPAALGQIFEEDVPVEETTAMPAVMETTVMPAQPATAPVPPAPQPPAPQPPPVESTFKIQAPKGLPPAPPTAPPTAPRPQPQPSGEPATILMKAPVVPSAPPPPTAPPPTATQPRPVVQSDSPATILMGAPVITPPVRPPTAPARPVAPPMPTPPPGPLPMPAPAPAPTGGGGLPMGLILGGGALVFLLGVGFAGVVVWKQRGGGTATTTLPASTVPVTQPVSTTLAPAVGSIHVESVPPGATVSVDGQPVGTTPRDVPDLAAGDHEVKLELPGYEPKTQKVAVTEGAQAELKVTLSRPAPTLGSAEIVSNPPGASVTVDGAPVGKTPLPEVKLRPGNHKVELSKEGYEPYSGSVAVQAGKKARLDAPLKLVPPPPKTEPPKPTVDTAKVYINSLQEVDSLAKKLSGPSVSYPERAPRLKSGEERSVTVSFVVSDSGEVTDVQVIQSGGKILDEAVVQAVAKWKYQPATKGGVKVKAKVAFKQTFRAG